MAPPVFEPEWKQIQGPLQVCRVVFGELTRLLDGQVELTGGLRYFEDKVTTTEISRLSDPSALLIKAGAKFDALSPRVVLSWHPSDRIMAYGSYSEGFRSGFPQAPYLNLPNFPPVKADNLTNYEFGAKGSLWSDRVIFDAAVFYIHWKDIQQLITVQTTSGTGVLLNVAAGVNGTSASGMGAEFGLSVRPFSGLELGVNASWNDLKMDADLLSGTSLLFQKGDRLTNSPSQTFGISAGYVFPLGGSGYNAQFSGSANYVSARQVRGLVNRVSTVIAGDSTLTSRLRFTVNSPGGWSATAFVDNLTDEKGRNIAVKAPDCLKALAAILGNVTLGPIATMDAILDASIALPEKDRPVLAAAIRHRCDVLMTGDRVHFAALYGTVIDGVQILAPAALAEKRIR